MASIISLYLSRRLAARYVRENYGIRCSEKWLAKLAVTGGGPRFYRNLRSVLYRRDSLDAWVVGRISGPMTSSSSPARTANSVIVSGEGLPFVDV